MPWFVSPRNNTTKIFISTNTYYYLMNPNTTKPVTDNKIGYNILRWFVNLHIRTNYKFHVIDAAKADNSCPTLFVGNHSNSAVDPLIILFSLQRKVHFIARGDVFKGWKAKVFDYFNMIPIFRREEGAENMAKNEESFEYIFAKLNERRSVTIYSEGNCEQAMHVRKFRKGTARICAEFEKLNTTQIPLNIQPVGLTYYSWDKFQSDVYIHYATPFNYSDIDFSTATTDAKRIHVFNAYVEQALKKVVLQIPETLQPMQFLLDEIICTSPTYTHVTTNKYALRQRLSQTLYAMPPINLLSLTTALTNYNNALTTHKLNHTNTLPTYKGYSWGNAVLLLLTLPVFVIGASINAVVFLVPSHIAKNKIKVVEFKASVRIILAFFISVIYFSLLIVTATILYNWIVGALVFPLSYCLGLMAYEWYKLFLKLTARYKWLGLVKGNNQEYITLLSAKQVIINELDKSFTQLFCGK